MPLQGPASPESVGGHRPAVGGGAAADWGLAVRLGLPPHGPREPPESAAFFAVELSLEGESAALESANARPQKAGGMGPGPQTDLAYLSTTMALRWAPPALGSNSQYSTLKISCPTIAVGGGV